jgi:hypothetical protein
MKMLIIFINIIVKCEFKISLMEEIKYTILYCVFVIPFSYGSGTVINICSGSNFLTIYGTSSGSTRQKVTVPVPIPVLVPQHCCATHRTFCLLERF